MISKQEILMGRVAEAELSPEIQVNLSHLVAALNLVRATYGKPMVVSSGYRSQAANSKVGGAKRSYHLSCQACDFRDADGALDSFLNSEAGQRLLESAGLWQEHPDSTPGWCHLDIGVRPMVARPGCLNRQFKP